MTIRQGQTVDFYIETDIGGIESASVSIRSGGKVSTVKDVSIDGSTVSFSMSQEDTMGLAPGKIEVQLKAKTSDGISVSNVMSDTVLESIGREVM